MPEVELNHITTGVMLHGAGLSSTFTPYDDFSGGRFYYDDKTGRVLREKTNSCPLFDVTSNPEFDWAKQRIGYLPSDNEAGCKVFSVADCDGNFDEKNVVEAIKYRTGLKVRSFMKGDGWAFVMSSPQERTDTNRCGKITSREYSEVEIKSGITGFTITKEVKPKHQSGPGYISTRSNPCGEVFLTAMSGVIHTEEMIRPPVSG